MDVGVGLKVSYSSSSSYDCWQLLEVQQGLLLKHQDSSVVHLTHLEDGSRLLQILQTRPPQTNHIFRNFINKIQKEIESLPQTPVF